MFDRYFSPALAFCLLLGGTLAVGSKMFGTNRSAVAAAATDAQTRVIQLPTVVITAKRAEPAASVASVDTSDATQPRVQ